MKTVAALMDSSTTHGDNSISNNNENNNSDNDNDNDNDALHVRSAFRAAEHVYKLKLRERKKHKRGKRNKQRQQQQQQNGDDKNKDSNTTANVNDNKSSSLPLPHRRAAPARRQGGVRLVADPLILSDALIRGELVKANQGVVVAEAEEDGKEEASTNNENDMNNESDDDDDTNNTRNNDNNGSRKTNGDKSHNNHSTTPHVPHGFFVLRSYLSVSIQQQLVRLAMEELPHYHNSINNHNDALMVSALPHELFCNMKMKNDNDSAQHDEWYYYYQRNKSNKNKNHSSKDRDNYKCTGCWQCVPKSSITHNDNLHSYNDKYNTTHIKKNNKNNKNTDPLNSSHSRVNDDNNDNEFQEYGRNGNSTDTAPVDYYSASYLIRKLRWVAVGPQYNWNTKEYKLNNNYNNSNNRDNQSDSDGRSMFEIPALLRDIALSADAATAETHDTINTTSTYTPRVDNEGIEINKSDTKDSDCMFRPSAALVNYYGAKDCLMAHVDQSERDLTKPIVAISLGVPAIFLIGQPVNTTSTSSEEPKEQGDTSSLCKGGRNMDEEPVAVLLRSGDVVVMKDEARTCVHGMPRIFTMDSNVNLTTKCTIDENTMSSGNGTSRSDNDYVDGFLPFELSTDGCPDDFINHAKYLRESRINISIRDVL